MAASHTRKGRCLDREAPVWLWMLLDSDLHLTTIFIYLCSNLTWFMVTYLANLVIWPMVCARLDAHQGNYNVAMSNLKSTTVYVGVTGWLPQSLQRVSTQQKSARCNMSVSRPQRMHPSRLLHRLMLGGNQKWEQSLCSHPNKDLHRTSWKAARMLLMYPILRTCFRL